MAPFDTYHKRCVHRRAMYHSQFHRNQMSYERASVRPVPLLSSHWA